MSAYGRRIVQDAQNFYIGVLTALLNETQIDQRACCHRLSALLGLLITFEVPLLKKQT